ncbi:histidine kinase [Chromobacterium sp. ATCC 53434]|uniref:ATP-binding protein n=1 Tax=Chromobacterium sp. (strain ATCC 53434 / SC 14030) TaxID=2059672 RepID=UPI000C784B13|nr:ATP-binding protein [Chromobacterium sp. ATCC 53434]AUH51281.1 histidine kinase [Chromobacterium sp. ATCC 53434]
MVDAVSFRTRARTIDHLGREQIADCPTAVSELWKNAYDAYANTVGLHIYDGAVPIAALTDDGHGMSRDEFIDKWLVVGTESKANGSVVPEEDRNGLPPRPKQGQKGIGRLSSAFLGPLLMVVSKRRKKPFTAALIDWRLFENPFLYLQDIEVPVVEFDTKEEIFTHIPAMFDELWGNLRGNGRDVARDGRIARAWKDFDILEASEEKASTRLAMEQVVAEAVFELRHLEQWPLWRGETDHGTILLIADIVFDLEAHLQSRIHIEDADAAAQAKDRLFQTLSNFSDPYADPTEISEGYGAEAFEYSVTTWEGALRRSVISSQREFDYHNLEDLEHVVDGRVDENGMFVGRVKAFGKWLDSDICILPKGDVSNRSNSKVGPFHIRLGAYQRDPGASSHPPNVHQQLLEQSEKYGGVMVYRNGLRVMPYGREDNDFFEIEKRRSLHAGRYFWSNRRTFGRIAITREGNPNLKDKAGREGFIDNTAVKKLRDLVENILIKTAYDYFGTDSSLQAKFLPEIKETRARERAEKERNKQRAAKRKRFRTNLRQLGPQLAKLCEQLDALADNIRVALPTSESEVLRLREQLRSLKDSSRDFALGEAPRELGSLENEYGEYRFNQRRVNELLNATEQSLNVALETIKPKAPREIVFSDLNSHAAFLQARLRKWFKEARELLEAEQQRISTLYEDRSKRYHALTLPLLDAVDQERISLTDALERLTRERDKSDFDNAETFEPYIAALRSLQENIDLETLASYGMDAVDEMRVEVDRLHSLAQLGITVEIIGHEIEGLELTISEGLDELPDIAKKTTTFSAVKVAHDALADRLRFLSPLKLSGPKFKAHLTGIEILKYIRRFFGTSMEDNEILIDATDHFLGFSVYEQPSRIFPVFINLINNAAYWVRQRQNDKYHIMLDVVDGKIVIGDNGPGVDAEDQKHLFTLFFTRKVRGGRGVGLHLCRANLAAGGHTIQYAVEDKFKILPGANFVIDFKGATYE